MKKTVLCSITLLATIISSHAFSQNYTYRMPVFGVQNANGKAQPSDNSNCELNKDLGFMVYNATDENGKTLIQEILDTYNLSYRNPMFTVFSTLNHNPIILDDEIDLEIDNLIDTYVIVDGVTIKIGNLIDEGELVVEGEPSSSGVTGKLYELHICGDAIPPDWGGGGPAV